MKANVLKVLLFAIAQMVTPFVAAQSDQQAVSLFMRFRLDSVRIDMSYADNQRAWDTFEHTLNSRYSDVPPEQLRLDIYSGASPEGTAQHNRWLGENRGQAIRSLVRQRMPGRIGNIVVHNECARWNALYDVIAKSNEPWRDEVLDIISMPASQDETKWDHREVKLRALHGGRVWSVLLEKYLPPLRSGTTAHLSKVSGGGAAVHDTIYVRCDDEPRCPDCDNALIAAVADSVLTARDSLLLERLQYPAWAVKTNLLMWGVVAPNIEVEIPLGRRNRWSLELEYFHPWFIWSENAHASQFMNLGAEVRLYLGNRRWHRWLDGWHIGLAAGVGYYDFEWMRHEGWQGEYVNAYVNVGYQHRWGRHWAIDAGLGFGVIPTKYRYYLGSSTFPEGREEEWDRHLMYQHSGSRVFFGATHAHVSIVYMFNAWPFRFRDRKLRAYREAAPGTLVLDDPFPKAHAHDQE